MKKDDSEGLAFKYAKDDFIEKINHDADNVVQAMNVNEDKLKSNHKWMREMILESCKSKAWERILIESDSFGELMINIFLFDKLQEGVAEVAQELAKKLIKR